MGKVQKVYAREFKQEAVRLAQTSGKPIAQVARETFVSRIPPSINGVRNWLSTAKKLFQAAGTRPNLKRKTAASNENWKECSRSVIS